MNTRLIPIYHPEPALVLAIRIETDINLERGGDWEDEDGIFTAAR